MFVSNLVEFSVKQRVACEVQNRSSCVATTGTGALVGSYH